MAPPSRHDFPAELYDFARALKGGYAERFDQILDRAFTAHEGLLLTGHGLRSIAGGGTNPVAQDALDRFRKRLHKSIGARVAHATDLPDALAARYGAVIGEMWADARTAAHQEFTDERARMEEAARQASEALSTETKARVQAEAAQRALQAKLDLANFDIAEGKSRLSVTTAELQAATQRAQTAETALATAEATIASQRASFEAELDAARAAAAALEAKLDAAARAYREEAAVLAGEHRAERESIRHEHLIAMDNARQESRRREEALQTQAKALQAKVDALQVDIVAQREAHTGQVAVLQAKASTAQEMLARQEARTEQLSHQIGVLTAERAGLASEVETLRPALQAATQQIQELKSGN